MAIQRRRKFVWLSPKKLHRLSVRARNFTSSPSDWAEVTLNLSALPDFVWEGAAALRARPLWWNQCIRVIWTPFPIKYRKWFDHYILFRKESVGPTEEEIASAKTKLEDSEFFLATTFERKALFSKTKGTEVVFANKFTAWNNYFFDHNIEKEVQYHYWVHAVDQRGIASSNYLGPDIAEWGKPQTPQWKLDWFKTEVHDINKWTCDVVACWDSGPDSTQPAGAEYYIIQRRPKNPIVKVWGFPLRIEHDYIEEDTILTGQGRYQIAVLHNFVVGKKYEFRIKAINIPGIGPNALVSEWSDIGEYKTLTDTIPPQEVSGVAANRFFWRGFNKGDYVRLRWDRFWANDPEGDVRAPILTEQVDYYYIYKFKGTDAGAQILADAINVHLGFTQHELGWDETTQLTSGFGFERIEAGKLGLTQYVDDNIEDTSGGTVETAWDFTWGAEGSTDEERATATISGESKVGTLYATSGFTSSDKHSGTYSFYAYPGGYIEWTDITSITAISEEGYFDCYVKGSLLVGGGGMNVFLAWYDTQNYINIYFSGTALYADRYGNNTYHTVNIPVGDWNEDPFSEWVNLRCRWSVDLNKLEVAFGTTDWYAADTTAPLESFVANPDFIEIGAFIDSNNLIDDVNFSLSYEPTTTEVKYHYFVTAVDVYGYESNVTWDGPSYDSVSFLPPPVPENLTYTRNFMSSVFGLNFRSLKLEWDRVSEATHYQIRIQTQRPGLRWYDDAEYPKSPWHYTPMLREERVLELDDAGEEVDELRATYIHPIPLGEGLKVWAEVSSWNRAGRSATWAQTGEIVMDSDDEPVGPVTDLRGDCMGVAPFFGVWGRVWLGVNLWWKPRPKYEGVRSYQINVWDPNDSIWKSCGSGYYFGASSHLYPFVRAHHFVGGRLLPQNETSLKFAVRSEGNDETVSDWAEVTVDFEYWWNLL